MEIRHILEKFNIYPHDSMIFEMALTHPSCNAEHNTLGDYERLEYIGDSVLGFVTADLIYKYYKDMAPGNMTKLRSNLVRTEALSNYALEIHLDEVIKTGPSINRNQLKNAKKILEDVFEALIGAIYVDQGINITYEYIKSFIQKDVESFNLEFLTDAKTTLQEQMQAEYRDSVHYVLIEQTGPAHDRRFKVNAMFNDIVLSTGFGKSKKEAEEDAARKALDKRSI